MLDYYVARNMRLNTPLSQEIVQNWQIKRIREIVDYATKHSDFYRKHLSNQKINSFEDFEKLPFTTPEDLQKNEMQMLCVSPNEINRVVTLTTSGSTGLPKRVFFTAEDQERTIEYFKEGISEFTKAGEHVMSLLPGHSPYCLNDLLSKALLQLGAWPTVYGFPTPENYMDLLNVILNKKINFLVGPCRIIADVARYSVEVGLSEKIADQMHGILAAAAYVPYEDSFDIERIWQCRVYEHYSMTETGYAGAVGCVEASGKYHIWESGLYYEIIDPITGKAVPDGEIGEIVITTLQQKAMPFIRYRTGDKSYFIPDKCTCRSNLRCLARVFDRHVEKKFLKDGRFHLLNIPNEGR